MNRLPITTLFMDFIESPSWDAYRAVRQAVISSKDYNPYSNELAEIIGLVDEERYDDARSLISAAMVNLILSPRGHLLMAMLAEKTGDTESAEMEKAVAAACADAILTTGDGSEQQPYLVVRTSDEHDLVQYLGKEFASQSMVEAEERRFDVVECGDGTEIWFDITDAYKKLDEIFDE